MSDQQTEVNYDPQYTPRDTGQHHHVPHDTPAPTRPTLKLSDPPPRQHRPWPLAARLAVAVLIIGLATGFTMSLASLHTVSKKATQASQLASAEAASLASMGRQLAAVQAKVAAPAKAYRPPAIYQHYGMCVSFSRNTGNGDLVDVNFTTPQVSAGSYTCNQGTFVSVVPAP